MGSCTNKQFTKEQTADQRRLVFIGIIEKEPGVVVKEALRDAIEKDELKEDVENAVSFPYQLADYSKFELDPSCQ